MPSARLSAQCKHCNVSIVMSWQNSLVDVNSNVEKNTFYHILTVVEEVSRLEALHSKLYLCKSIKVLIQIYIFNKTSMNNKINVNIIISICIQFDCF